MPKQFWVIGGEYHSLQFEQIVEGTSRILGPFQDIEKAREVWQERSQATRSQAATRYTIVTNAECDTAGR